MKHTLVPWMLLAVLLAPACHPSESRHGGASSFPAEPPNGQAIVHGTVFDLKTGDPAAGVEVTFDGARAARTDEHGLFELGPLAAGASGELRARASDGREGTVQVLALHNERREVVVYVRAN